MNMPVSFLRKPWTKKKSSQPADVSFHGFNGFAKSLSPSLRHGSTRSATPSLNSPYVSSEPELNAEMKNSVFIPHFPQEVPAGREEPVSFVWRVHEDEKDVNVRPQAQPLGKRSFDVYGPPFKSSGHHPRPGLSHRSTLDHPPEAHPDVSPVFSTTIPSGSMQTPSPQDSHSHPPPDVTQNTPPKNTLPEGAEDVGLFVTSDLNNGVSMASQSHGRSPSKHRSHEEHPDVNSMGPSVAVRAQQPHSTLPNFFTDPADHGSYTPAKTRRHNIIPPSLSAVAYQRDAPSPSEANQSIISPEDECGTPFTSDFSLSLFPVPPTSPLIIRKHPLPKPLVLCQSLNKVPSPESSSSFTPDTTPLATPATPKSSQPHVARNPSSPTSILKKPSGSMIRHSTSHGSLPVPSITPYSRGFRSMDSKWTSLPRGPGLRLASSSSNLRNEPATTHRTTASDSTSEQSTQPTPERAGVRQRALSRPEIVTHNPLTSDAYLNPRPAPKPFTSTAEEQVEWGYAV